jgi:putative redox protein
MAENWKEVAAEWKGEMAFHGWNPSGAAVQMGTLNGQPGISPMEMLLLGVAGCTGVDIVSILQKKREPLKALRIKVRGRRADTYPKVYKEIHITYLLWGEGLSTEAVEQAIQLSEDKYCSASNMMRPTAEIRTSYRILAPGESEEQDAEEKLNL